MIIISGGISLYWHYNQVHALDEQIKSVPFYNITVNTAYNMITNGSFPNLIILDVRTVNEYYTNHLHNAILIPHDELETRLDELEGFENHEIIVYCGIGYRSEIACEILVQNNFKKVYNMLGGISDWMDVEYPHYTCGCG